MASWGYAKDNGPPTWYKSFPVAAGKNQSPIDIRRNLCTSDAALHPIVADYASVEVGELSNTGHSWKAQVTGGKSSLTGGPLGVRFALEQFHAHWGHSDQTGSEHTLDGTHYPAELHLVHWNTERFKSFGDAASISGGLAVLGIFLKVGKSHPEMEKLTKLMQHIPYQGQTVNVAETINCANFLPKNKSYYTYNGSLTTPPCHESVNWIVFENPIEVSQEQLNAFRSMKSYCRGGSCPCDELKGCMVDNYRPCCPINDRPVKTFKETTANEE